jgi:SprT protein
LFRCFNSQRIYSLKISFKKNRKQRMKLLELFKKAPETKPSEIAGTKLKEILEKKIPTQAIEYSFELWREEPFSFTLSRTRNSCFGNYTFKDGQHKITINHDLNPYAFVLTYIHEVAHQRAWLQKSRRRIQPHGKEWKQQFQKLMQPILNENVFPSTIIWQLKDYMADPAASSISHAGLAEALRSFDENKNVEDVLLAEVSENQTFIFRERVFVKLEKRRTRVLCVEQKSKKRYTILSSARVKLA